MIPEPELIRTRCEYRAPNAIEREAGKRGARAITKNAACGLLGGVLRAAANEALLSLCLLYGINAICLAFSVPTT